MSKKSNFPLLTLASKRARKITPNELGSHFLHFCPFSDYFLSFNDFSIFTYLKNNSTKKKVRPGRHFQLTTFPPQNSHKSQKWHGAPYGWALLSDQVALDLNTFHPKTPMSGSTFWKKVDQSVWFTGTERPSIANSRTACCAKGLNSSSESAREMASNKILDSDFGLRCQKLWAKNEFLTFDTCIEKSAQNYPEWARKSFYAFLAIFRLFSKFPWFFDFHILRKNFAQKKSAAREAFSRT